MTRTLVGFGVGFVCGVLALGTFGAVEGYLYGSEGVGPPPSPPGLSAALLGAFRFTAYFWWLTGTVGGVIGGLAAFGSWLVRPRTGEVRRAGRV
jgi:hypothetical protein